MVINFDLKGTIALFWYISSQARASAGYAHIRDWIQGPWMQSVTFKLQATNFLVVCTSMKKARGSSRQGAGRPQNEGATQSKVSFFLGCDKEAR